MHLPHFLFEAFLPGQFSPAEQPAHFAPLFFTLTRCAIAPPAITSRIPITIQSARLKSAISALLSTISHATILREIRNYHIIRGQNLQATNSARFPFLTVVVLSKQKKPPGGSKTACRLTAFPELFVQNYFIMFSYLVIRFTTKITTPNMVSTTPVARFNVAVLALLANFAAILAHISVNSMHKIRQSTSGIPPIAK